MSRKRTSDELRSPEFEPLASIWSDTLSKLEYLLANFGPLGFYHGSLVSSLVVQLPLWFGFLHTRTTFLSFSTAVPLLGWDRLKID